MKNAGILKLLLSFMKTCQSYDVQLSMNIENIKYSADADGGPRSRVRTAGHSAQPPIDVSGNFSAHVSAE